MTILQPALQTLAAPLLVERAITASKAGDNTAALALFAQALAQDGANELAWLWLSGLVADAAARRFCLNRVLQINPDHSAAQRGLAALPADVRPRAPALHVGKPESACGFPGCAAPATSTGQYCGPHWRAVYRLTLTPAPLRAAEQPAHSTDQPLLSASALGERLGIPTRDLLALCVDLGWITRGEQGWLVTPAGQQLGAVQQQHAQTGVPYVHWPPGILDHPALPRTLRHNQGNLITASSCELALRERIPARQRTLDGHMVRTRAELLIDNWLYNAMVVHAYERPLPTEQAAYCDFYLPAGRLYLEYWGTERDSAYQAHAATKPALYTQHGLHLVALDDQQLRDLDSCLPLLLGQFGVC